MVEHILKEPSGEVELLSHARLYQKIQEIEQRLENLESTTKEGLNRKGPIQATGVAWVASKTTHAKPIQTSIAFPWLFRRTTSQILPELKYVDTIGFELTA